MKRERRGPSRCFVSRETSPRETWPGGIRSDRNSTQRTDETYCNATLFESIIPNRVIRQRISSNCNNPTRRGHCNRHCDETTLGIPSPACKADFLHNRTRVPPHSTPAIPFPLERKEKPLHSDGGGEGLGHTFHVKLLIACDVAAASQSVRLSPRVLEPREDRHRTRAPRGCLRRALRARRDRDRFLRQRNFP